MLDLMLKDKEIHKLWLIIGDPFIPRYLDVGRRTEQASITKVLTKLMGIAILDENGWYCFNADVLDELCNHWGAK